MCSEFTVFCGMSESPAVLVLTVYNVWKIFTLNVISIFVGYLQQPQTLMVKHDWKLNVMWYRMENGVRLFFMRKDNCHIFLNMTFYFTWPV